MKIKNFKCPQCGSSYFNRREKTKMRCAYCNSLFEISEQLNVVSIKKGVKVVIGKNVDIIIKGGLDIEDGAEIVFNE